MSSADCRSSLSVQIGKVRTGLHMYCLKTKVKPFSSKIHTLPDVSVFVFLIHISKVFPGMSFSSTLSYNNNIHVSRSKDYGKDNSTRIKYTFIITNIIYIYTRAFLYSSTHCPCNIHTHHNESHEPNHLILYICPTTKVMHTQNMTCDNMYTT